MTDTPDGLALDWLELPRALDQARLPMPPSTADFLQVAQLANLLTSLFWGTNDFYESPENRLAAARWREDSRMDYVVARLADDVDAPGRIVGFGFLAQEPGVTTAEVWVGVHPDFRRAGIGSALLGEVEAEALRRGRTTLQSWTDNALVAPAAVGSGPVFVRGTSLDTGLTPVVPPAGKGPAGGPDVGYPALRPEAPDAAFAAARGYALAQLEWCSVLDLGRAAGQALRAESAAAPGGDYELVGWDGACPEEHAESLADLMGRMLTDAPTGDLDIIPETWDVERLRAEERAREEIGLSMITCAALHRPSGRLVGHSDIETFRDLPQAAYQGNTLVHPEHRGRRLAVLLKAANVSRLLRARPTTERLYAWAAEDNPAILRANAELGFVPVSTHPGWQKRA
jgi:GNAT superfamily N-acetyltransferase